MIIESIALFVGKKILGQIFIDEIWYKKIWHKINPPKEYKDRLYKCINETITQYDKENTSLKYQTNKFPFYHSQILLESLSKYILFENGSAELLTKIFDRNPNIIKPTAEQLAAFYNLFLEKVNSDEILKTKFVEENYKQKIFDNSSQIDEVINKLDTVIVNTQTIIKKMDIPTHSNSASKELTAKLPLLNSKIVKRETDLADIRNRLLRNKQVVLVNGMGGIGKTTLAQVYITEYYNEYKYIAWISLNSDNFIADFINTAGLKESLHIPLGDKTPREYFNQIIMALKKLSHENNEHSLIIIDNAEEDIVQFHDYLPHPPHWHILATSRHKIEEFDVKELDSLNEEQAVALFKLYYKRTGLTDNEIRKIVGDMEYHTLTIEILAKTAQNDRLDVLQAVNTLADNYSVEVNTRHAEGKINKITSYLASIFDMSKLSKDEIWLLKQLYFLPPLYHSFELINTVLPSKKGDQHNKTQKILSKLVAKGWCLFNETTEEYKLHRIIGDVIKHSVDIPFKDISPLIDSISTLLLIDQTKDNPIDKFQWAIFGNNLLKLVSYVENPIIATLQNNLALVLQALGDYNSAKVLLEKTKNSYEKNFGIDHPSTAGSYSNLALVLKDLGDYNAAKVLLEKAKNSYEKNFGEDHPSTAVSYSNLALVLQDLGDYNAAKVLLEKAKNSYEKNFGEDHPSTAVSYSNLALVLNDLGDYNAAKVLFVKAKNSDEKNFGEEHPSTAISYSNLALLLQDLGDYNAAKVLLEKAKNSNVKNFGEEHPSTAVRYSNLASVLQDLGDNNAAKVLFVKAKNSDEKNFGVEHPSTADSYSNLASVLQELGDYNTAKVLLEKAKNIFDKTLGINHPHALIAKQNLEILIDEKQNKNSQ
ncbi:MAG: tetratricopeptide repeat protein [Bacteroidales bacterium]|nr:tetratricopeptide repeat protein [Bacteroidales bacterium]